MLSQLAMTIALHLASFASPTHLIDAFPQLEVLSIMYERSYTDAPQDTGASPVYG